jgi:hypothetical protein
MNQKTFLSREGDKGRQFFVVQFLEKYLNLMQGESSAKFRRAEVIE